MPGANRVLTANAITPVRGAQHNINLRSNERPEYE